MKKRFRVLALALIACIGLTLKPATVRAAEEGSDSKEYPEFRYLSDFEDSEIVRKSIGWNDLYLSDQNEKGNRISLKVDGVTITFRKGILAHAQADLVYDLGEDHPYTKFAGYLGVDSSQPAGNVKFVIAAFNDSNDYTELVRTGELRGSGESQYMEVPIGGFRYLEIIIDKNGSNGNDHSVVANAIVYSNDYNPAGQSIVKELSYYQNEIRKQFGSIERGLEAGNLTEEQNLLLQQYILVNNAKYVSLNHFMTESDDAEANKEFMATFFTDVHKLELFNSGGTPIGGNYIKALEVLQHLYADSEIEAAMDANPLYEKMVYAIALTHSSNVINWMDAKIAAREGYPGVERFKIYKSMHERGLLRNEVFDTLEVEELRWVVDTMMYDFEIEWANDYARNHPRGGLEENKNYTIVYSPHHHIAYKSGYNYNNAIYRDPNGIDPKTNLTWRVKYNTDAFNLPYENGVCLMWHLFEEGSVCGGISKTGANLAQSFGVPSAVIGQPGHAAFLVYNIDANGNGVWGIDNDVSGWTGSEKGERMPLDWGNAKDTWNSHYAVSYVTMAQAALNDYNNYLKAEELVSLASAAADDSAKESALKAALRVLPYHMDAWYQLINLKIANEAPNSELLEFVEGLTNNMWKFPTAMHDLSNIVMQELSLRATMGDNDAQVKLDTSRLRRAAALTDGSVLKGNEYPNANVTVTMAKYFLGTNDNKLATFSFDGEDAGKLVFVDGRDTAVFQYKLEGSECDNWSNTVIAERQEDGKLTYTFTPDEIEEINDEDDIIILLEGLPDESKNYKNIDILGSAAPNLYANDRENRLLGNITNVQYREADTNAAWNDLTAATIFEGDADIEVRIKAHGVYCASETRAYAFTEDTDTEVRSYISNIHQSVKAYSSAQGGDNNARSAIDGRLDTMWHTNWTANSDLERFIVIELDEPVNLSGVDYTPRQSGTNGDFQAVSIYVSMDNDNWTQVYTAESIPGGRSAKHFDFDAVAAKFVKVKADRGAGNFASAALLEFYEDSTKPRPTPIPTATPTPTATPAPTDTPVPTDSPTPTVTPKPTTTPKPTATPKPTSTPKATEAPTPTATPTATPNATPIATVVVTPTVTPKSTNKVTIANPTPTAAGVKAKTTPTPKPIEAGTVQTLENIVKSSEANSTVYTTYPEGNVLPKKVLAAMKDKNVNLSIKETGKPEWLIKGSNIEYTYIELDLRVNVYRLPDATDHERKALVESLFPNHKPIVADFEHDGFLPGMSLIRVPLSAKELEYLGGNLVDVYHIDEVTKNADRVAKDLTITDNSYVEFDISTCSPYVIVQAESVQQELLAAAAEEEVMEIALLEEAEAEEFVETSLMVTPPKKDMLPLYMLIAGAGALLILIGSLVVLILRRRR